MIKKHDVLLADIEAQIRDIQARKKVAPEPVPGEENDKVGLGQTGVFDTDIYGAGKYDGYVTSIAADDEAEEEEGADLPAPKRATYTAPKVILLFCSAKMIILQSEHFIWIPGFLMLNPIVLKWSDYKIKGSTLGTMVA